MEVRSPITINKSTSYYDTTYMYVRRGLPYYNQSQSSRIMHRPYHYPVITWAIPKMCNVTCIQKKCI